MTQENLLARYKILHELGRGATGVVYAARDRETGAVVALKRIDPALSGKPDARVAERFLKHVRSARRLKHRNIVEIHDAGEVAGTVYVAMEMLEGESLRDVLDRGPLPIARAIQIAHDIASGLAHAHLEGVVHGAVKPSNVIVMRTGVVKITDFGIGQLEPAALLPGAAAGGLGYLSPEQMRGEPVDHRCDIFSAGVLFYEMLTHRRPFEGGSPKEIEENVLHAEPPPPSELNPHVPRALDPIVFNMLVRQPASRMPGAPILLRELQSLEDGLGLGSGASAGTNEPTASVPPVAPGPGVRAPDPDREVFDYQKAMAMMERESRRERSAGSRPGMFAAFALALAALGMGLAGLMYYPSASGELRNAVSRFQETLATALATSRPTAPALVTEATREDVLPSPNAMSPEPLAAEPSPLAQTASVGEPVSEQPAEPRIPAARMAEAPATVPEPQPLAPEPGPSAQSESVPDPAPEPQASGSAAPAPKLPRATQPAAKVREPQPRGTARLILAISPRGEIYIDGEHHGTTPPITTFDLEPGMHRIEVRSGSRTPYLTYMTVQAGDVRRIRHDFDTSRAVHPPRSSASWQNSNRAAR